MDGTEMPENTSIFLGSEVTSDDIVHLKIINESSIATFAPKSNFNALINAYQLNRGRSWVITQTGMTAYLPNCYSVTPVSPVLPTLYEVNWSGTSAWVYARTQDVHINYWQDGDRHHPDESSPPRQPDQDWIVKEGHVARIRDVKLCKPLLDWWTAPNLPTALELAGTAAIVTSEPFWNLSAEGPNR